MHYTILVVIHPNYCDSHRPSSHVCDHITLNQCISLQAPGPKATASGDPLYAELEHKNSKSSVTVPDMTEVQYSTDEVGTEENYTLPLTCTQTASISYLYSVEKNCKYMYMSVSGWSMTENSVRMGVKANQLKIIMCTSLYSNYIAQLLFSQRNLSTKCRTVGNMCINGCWLRMVGSYRYQVRLSN